MNHKASARTQFLVQLGYFSPKFYGVQEQPKLETVLGALRKRIEKIAHQPAKALMVSARTDKGVTALKNYSTFWLKNPVNENEVIKFVETAFDDGLCGLIAVKTGFHTNARGSSFGKIYRYTIIDNCDANILTDHFLAWRIAPVLNIDAMKQAAQYFVGEHDFSSFRASGCDAASAIKEIYYVKIYKNQQGYTFITISGNAFLRKMIRNMVAALVEVGTGLRAIEDIQEILEQKNRKAAGMTAPACGLMLLNVNFLES